MSEKRLKKQLLKKQLFAKNRLVVLNEDTFEELFFEDILKNLYRFFCRKLILQKSVQNL